MSTRRAKDSTLREKLNVDVSPSSSSSSSSPPSSSLVTSSVGDNDDKPLRQHQHQQHHANLDDVSELIIPALGTTKNIAIITMFFLFGGIAVGVINGMAIVSYIQWGLLTVWLSVSSTLSILFQIYMAIVVAYWGDRWKSKHGRRKPFVIGGFILGCICVIGGAFPPSKSPVVLAFWFILSQNLFYAGTTACAYLSMYSWLIESSAGPADYARIFTISYNAGTLPGAIIGLVLTMIMGPQLPAILSALGGGVALYFLCKYVPSRIVAKVERQPALLPSFRTCIRTKEFRTLFVNRCLIKISQDTASNLAIIVIEIGYANNLKQVSEYLLMTLVAVVIGGISLSFLFGQLVQTMDKLLVFKRLLLFVAFLAFAGFFLSLSPSSWPFLIYVMVGGAFFYPVLMMDNFFVRDLITSDTFLTGLNRENLFQMSIEGPAGIVSSFFGTIPVVLVYASGFREIQDASDDDDKISEHYEWNSAVVWQCKVYCTLLVCAVASIGYWSIRDYPIDDTVAAYMNEMVNFKSAKKMVIQQAQIDDDSSGVAVATATSAGCANDVNLPPPSHHEFGEGDDIDLDRLDERELSEFGSIADDNNHMLMMHFSVLEIDSMAQEGDLLTDKIEGGGSASTDDGGTATNIKKMTAVQRISRSNLVGLVLGSVTTTAVVAAIIMQLLANASSVAVFFAMALIASSLYTYYEYLRRDVLLQLQQLSPSELKARASASSIKNHEYAKTVGEMVKKGEIPSRKKCKPVTSGGDNGGGENDKNGEFGSSNAAVVTALASTLPELEEVKLKGYKRIYLVLTLLLIFSLLAIVILA